MDTTNDTSAGGNVTPQEQAMYDQVMIAARKNIFGDVKDDTRFKMVVQRLAQAKGDLAENIGGIAAVTMLNISGAAQKQGKMIPGDVLFHAGDELVDDIIEIAERAGMMKPEQRDEIKKQAMFAGLKMFGQHQMQTGQSGNRATYQQELAQMKGGKGAPSKPVPAAQPSPPPPSGIINAARQGATQ